jgi:nicotinamidase-related amidase
MFSGSACAAGRSPSCSHPTKTTTSCSSRSTPTTLDVLLAHLGADTLILTGIAGNFCVLFTAHDAYMRDFNLLVPGD